MVPSEDQIYIHLRAPGYWSSTFPIHMYMGPLPEAAALSGAALCKIQEYNRRSDHCRVAVSTLT